MGLWDGNRGMKGGGESVDKKEVDGVGEGYAKTAAELKLGLLLVLERSRLGASALSERSSGRVDRKESMLRMNLAKMLQEVWPLNWPSKVSVIRADNRSGVRRKYGNVEHRREVGYDDIGAEGGV